MGEPLLPGVVRAVHALDAALSAAAVPYAVGGALALAYCVGDPRATADVDLTVLVEPGDAGGLQEVLAGVVDLSEADLSRLRDTGQAERLSTLGVRVDLFLPMACLHHEAVARAVRQDLGGRQIPFLSCGDLATFKVLFDRTKDWVDLAEMRRAGLDVARVRENLYGLFGQDDEVDAVLARLERAG